MNFRERLKEIGLNSSEVRVYIWLLENGIATPPRIAIGTRIARANCYHVLEELKAKELINEQARGKRKAYVARDPRALLLSVDRKKEIIEDLLPDLRGMFVRQKNKPKIQFFDGWEEVKQIYLQSLTAEKIIALGSIKKIEELDKSFFLKYHREIQKNKIIFYDILSNPWSTEFMQEINKNGGGLYETKLLPSRYQNTATDILIWKDTIALISLGDPIFGTVLTSIPLYHTISSIFELLWEKL
jgi:hypothetical protein